MEGNNALRRNYVPRLFEQHLGALKSILEGSTVSLVADETTDIRDGIAAGWIIEAIVEAISS